MTTEDLSRALGKPGKFQVLLYIMLGANYTYVCWSHLGMAFIGGKTKHHCRVENKSDIENLVPVIMKDGVKQWDKCHLYSGYNKTEKIPCPNGWSYQLQDRENTVIAEWDLVCDNAYKTSLATTMYFCGVALSTLVFGPLSDKFGRRPVVLSTMYSPLVVGIALFFCRYYIAFVILRFLLGFLLQGLQMVSFISFVEVFVIQYRTAVGVLVGVFWSIGVVTLALMAYFIQDWKYIQLFSTTACLLQIGLICFLPESFRWLLAKKRVKKAGEVVANIATFNKRPFPQEIFDKVAQNCLAMDTNILKVDKNYTIIDIFKSSVLRRRSLVMALVWFSTSFSYYGLSLNITSLAGNKYLNFAISGIFEAVIAIISIFVLNRFGRRRPLCLYSIVAGSTCILAGILLNLSATDALQKFITSLALIGRVSASGCFATIFIYTSELYPTVIRNVGLGAGIFWARVGSIIAPQIILLGVYTSKTVPFIIFGAFIFTAGVLCLFLPETLNVRLPETMADADKFIKMKRESVNVEGQNFKLIETNGYEQDKQ